MSGLCYHSSTAQAAYHDLVRLLCDERVSELRGKPVLKNINGRSYWYDRYRLGTRIADRYVGEDTADLRARIDRHAEIRAAEKGAERERSRLVRLLRAEGFLPVGVMSGQLPTALARAGAFRLGVTLVGSLAFRFYEGELGVRIGADRSATAMDVDIASFERLSLAIDDRADPALPEVLSEFSFDPVPGSDRPNDVWQWRHTNQQTLVEFLTPSFEDEEGIRKLPALGVKARALHHLNYLIAEPLRAAILYRRGALVQIPQPARFAIHKLIVADRRRHGPDTRKAFKDRAQAAFLVRILAEDQPDALAEACEDARSRGPAWRKRLAASLERMPETACILKSLPS